jgi:hypothetical protein
VIAALATPGCTTLRRVFDFKEQVAEAKAMVRISDSIRTEGPADGTLIVVLARLVEGDELKGADDYPRTHPGTFLFITVPGRLSLPRFRGHPGSHESAVGVCHGETEATSVLG